MDQATVFTPMVIKVTEFCLGVDVFRKTGGKRAWKGESCFLNAHGEPLMARGRIELPFVPMTPFRAQRSAYSLWATVQVCDDYVPDIVLFEHSVGAYGIFACKNLRSEPVWRIRSRSKESA